MTYLYVALTMIAMFGPALVVGIIGTIIWVIIARLFSKIKSKSSVVTRRRIKYFIISVVVLIVLFLVTMVGISIALNANGSYGNKTWEEVRQPFIDDGFKCFFHGEKEYDSVYVGLDMQRRIDNSNYDKYAICGRKISRPTFISMYNIDMVSVLFGISSNGEVVQLKKEFTSLE